MVRAATLLLALLPPLPAASARPLHFEHVDVELVGETGALVPGQRNWIGLRIHHAAHWHSYWINPGDSGLPWRLEWTLPVGLEAGEIAWPAPERFAVGGLYNFGYDGDVLLPIPLQVSDTVRVGTTARIAVEARWLACREECVPGKARLTLSLPVARTASARVSTRKAFATAHAARPHAGPWTGAAHLTPDGVEISLQGQDLPTAEPLDAFVVQTNVVGYAPPRFAAAAGRLTVTFPRSEYLTQPPPSLGLVVVEGRPPLRRGHSISVPFAAAPKPATTEESQP